MTSTLSAPALRSVFGDRLQVNVPLARYTAARLGGPAEALIVAGSAEELVETAQQLWQLDAPFLILGGGSNVLVSDVGVPGVVVLNQARAIRFEEDADPARAWAESGANWGLLARQAAARGLAGLEWAAGIPGTVGGAIYGNAGAHGSETADYLQMAEILHRTEGRQQWPVDRLGFEYRSSVLKREKPPAVILAASFGLQRSTPEVVQAQIERFGAIRKRTQPPGASMGSMFKNPPGDYAGRLIEAAGLKGRRVGGAQISELHANFFVNQAEATATDIFMLIELARRTVADRFGVTLELEVELVGAWQPEGLRPLQAK